MAQPNMISQKAAALLDRFPGPITIHCSRRTYLMLLALGLLGTALLIWTIWPFWPLLYASTKAQLLFGGMLATVWGFMLMVAIMFAKDFPRLTLDADGIAYHALLGTSTRRWHDVSRFVSRFIYVGFSDTSQPANFLDKLNRVGSRGRRIMFSFFDLGAMDLACLMTAWRERVLAQPR